LLLKHNFVTLSARSTEMLHTQCKKYRNMNERIVT